MYEPSGSVGAALKKGYSLLFGLQWPLWVGGLLFGAVNVFMFAYEKPWSVADGVRNWGNWFFNTASISEMIIIQPHLYSTSLLNFGIIFGACAAALFARQFQLRLAPGRELLKGLVGGVLMGVGSSLSFGCNIGGFFSATSALSMAGIVMFIGLITGAFIGLKLLIWEISYLRPPTPKVQAEVSENWRKIQPITGLMVLIFGIVLAFVYDEFDYPTRGGFLLFGLFIGIIMQRTRFCFVKAFRDPFMTGNGEAVKAVALAVVISTIGFTIIKWSDLRDWDVFVNSGFWVGSLAGGVVFGIGMSLSGGCASGSLWRAGEGQIKLWIALLSFALSGSYFRQWLEESGWSMKLGESVFLPDLVEWKYGLLVVIAVMVLWTLIAVWNEVHKKLVAV